MNVSMSQDGIQHLLDRGEQYKHKREKLRELKIKLNESA